MDTTCSVQERDVFILDAGGLLQGAFLDHYDFFLGLHLSGSPSVQVDPVELKISRMTDKPKIHVFLGAPPPSALVPEPESGPEPQELPPAEWKTMELLWRSGRLRPATGEVLETGTFSEEPARIDHSNCCHASICHQHGHQTSYSPCQDDTDSQSGQGNQLKADKDNEWTNPDQALESLLGQAVQSNANHPLCSREDRPADRLEGQDDQLNADKEDLCPGSIQDYLDSCFPAAQNDPGPSPSGTGPKVPPCEPPLSLQTQFLSSWTLSQALVLRDRRGGVQSGASPEKTPPPKTTPPKQTPTPPSVSSSTPELFSPATTILSCPLEWSPQAGSMELFFTDSLMTGQRMEEGGVILESTPDGVLCSQGGRGQQDSDPNPGGLAGPHRSPAEAFHSPSMSPERKRAKASAEVSGTEAWASTTTASTTTSTTLLAHCTKPGVQYSVLVGVVHPCHLKEIKVKSGMWAGSCVPLASIVVADQSGVEMKVVLWRQAAFWSLTVYPGDIALITGLEVNHNRWRGETVLQSSYRSRLLNLGQITATTSPPAPQSVNSRTLSVLCGFLCKERPLVVSLPLRVHQELEHLPYARLSTLRPHTLVHALLRVTHADSTSVWRAEAGGFSRSGRAQRAVLTVEQAGGQQGALVLWGAALSWLQRINRNRGAVWDFRVLLVRDSVTSDLPELHSTCWSSAHPVFPDDSRALEFCRTTSCLDRTTSCLELDLHTLLSQKYTGNVELRVRVTALQFQTSSSQNAPAAPLDASSSLDRVLEALGGDVTYTGCGRCASELDTDANGVYRPCYPCLPHTAVRRYYRPVLLTAAAGADQVCVQVPPLLLEKMLLETPAERLYKPVSPGSEVKHVRLVAERIRSLVSPPNDVLLTVRSHFLCDENSVPLAQDFLLLDFQLPGR